MEIVAEEWRWVAGRFAGWKYEVSSCGRVRSRHFGRCNDLAVKTGPYGYPTVNVNHEGKKITVSVHILLAEAFIGARPEGMTVNHIDGNKRNNTPKNLEYLSQRDNVRHAIRIGLWTAGRRGGPGRGKPGMNKGHKFNRVLNDQQVEAIKELRRRGVTQQFLARWFETPRSTIWGIQAGRLYLNQ